MTIGHKMLTEAQSMAVRVAVAHYLSHMYEADYDLGEVKDGYKARLTEVQDLISDDLPEPMRQGVAVRIDRNR